MAFCIIEQGGVTSPRGFLASGITAGLKVSGKPDMALIHSPTACVVSGAFTSNRFAAAPVIRDRQILAGNQMVHSVVVNSGNANACTGPQGLRDADRMAAETAKFLGVSPAEVLVSSTGRIGVPMPMDCILGGVKLATEALAADGGAIAAEAIMTTDTRPKSFAVSLEVDGRTVVIGGMTKGAGMINPNMRLEPPQATMLAYVTSDACIGRKALDQCLGRALNQSFNRITVDGDTSTNDTMLAFANGEAGNREIGIGTPEFEAFSEAFTAVLAKLAREMVLDGEGVTRFVEVNVSGAASDADARCCAEAIANSALCKTAWFGADPNWGRVLCAAGYSGIAFDPGKVNLDYDDMPIVRQGMDAGVPEKEQVGVVSQAEFQVNLDLGSGPGCFTVWTCDLTYEYVKINADYHT